MEFLIHFLFVLIKISILSCAYATILLLIFKIIKRLTPNSKANNFLNSTFRSWFVSGFIISVLLFLYMFTYYGNHGLGDTAVVPIGHYKVVTQINGIDSYIEKEDGEQLGIKKFMFDQKNLYAETDESFSEKPGKFVIWNLHDDTFTFYISEADYLIAVE